MKKKYSILLVALLLFFTLGTVSSANTARCGSSPENCFNVVYHDYSTVMSSSGTGVTKVQSDMYLPAYPAVYYSSNSLQFVMASNSDPSTLHYVQTGVWKANSSATGQWFFYEFSDSSSTYYQVFDTAAPTAGSTQNYRVEKDSAGLWKAYRGSTRITTSAYYPSWKADRAIYGEEVNSNAGTAYNAQFFGSNASRAYVDNKKATIDGVDDNAVAVASIQDPSAFQSYSSSRVYMWDGRY